MLDLEVSYGYFTSTEQTACNEFTWNNVTYTASGIYLYIYEDNVGCISLDTLYLTIDHGQFNTYFAKDCDSHEWHGTTYTETGVYPYHYLNVNGCPSIDSLKLTIAYSSHRNENVMSCDQYQWHGEQYDSTGIYVFSYENNVACASSDTLDLTIIPSTHLIDTLYGCDSLRWNGSTYYESGTYWYDYTNVEGCPSADTLRLTVNYGIHTSTTRAASNYYVWYGDNYYYSGTYTHHYFSENGCPSVDTLHLTVRSSSNSSETMTACDRFVWHDEEYTQSGRYLYRYTDGLGIQSVDTLYLTINHSTHHADIITACDIYAWNGTSYTVSGQYRYSYINTYGCPSVDTLHLTVNYSNEGTAYYTVCDSMTWIDGNTYTVSTTSPSMALTNASGCDSITHLNLIVFYTAHGVVHDSFCIGTEYIFNGISYIQGGYYVDTLKTIGGCDSLIGLDLTMLQPPALTLASTYSCSDRSYTITVNADVEYIYWNSAPEDPTLNGQERNDTIKVSPTVATTYTVYADYRTHLLCPATRSITLEPVVVPQAGISLTPAFVTEDNRLFIAVDSSSNATERRWFVDDVELPSHDNRITHTIARGLDSVHLTLQVSNERCADTTTVTVPVVMAALYTPNVFTPTEEYNSFFRVNITGVEEFEISIYTRQGLLVYRSNDINAAWDGTHNGNPCQQGAYVYSIHYTDQTRPGVWQKYVGTVLLIR